MKKLLFIPFLVYTIILCGCNVASNNNNFATDKKTSSISEKTSSISEKSSISNETLSIFDINNKKIGEIEHYGMITQTNDSIIYTKIPTGSTNSITEMDYYRYILATKNNIKLGTVKDWSYQTSDTAFINNHLYLYITTDIDKPEIRTLKFFDVDLNNNKMSEITSEVGGFPYNSMTAVDNRVLMTKILKNGCHLEEYDTITKKVKTIMSFDFDDKAQTGEAIRQVTSDESTISLLMLKMQAGTNVKLRADIYDLNMNFLRSVDMSSISSNENELRQGVSNFVVSNDYVYYENFSTTRFLGKISGNDVNQILETNSTFEIASETVKNASTNLFYQSFSANNDLFLFNKTSGVIEKATFNADNKKYQIINVTRDTNNKLLLVMYYRDPDTGERLTPKLYYISQSDLKFIQA